MNFDLSCCVQALCLARSGSWGRLAALRKNHYHTNQVLQCARSQRLDAVVVKVCSAGVLVEFYRQITWSQATSAAHRGAVLRTNAISAEHACAIDVKVGCK